MRSLLRAVMAVSGFGLCMLISFSLVRHWTHALPPGTGVSQEAAEAAPALRNVANGLASLGNDLFPRLAGDGPATPEAMDWAKRVVPERLAPLMVELDHLPPEMEEAQLCRDAAERLRRLATEPNNRALRTQALSGLRVAIETAEAYITRHQADGYCKESPQPVRF